MCATFPCRIIPTHTIAASYSLHDTRSKVDKNTARTVTKTSPSSTHLHNTRLSLGPIHASRRQRPHGMQSQIPTNWPEGTKYLRAPSYSKKLPKDKLDTILLSKADPSSKEPVCTTRGPYANVRITQINDASHPAHGQYGLFATQHLPPNSFILPYLGYVHDQYDLDETSDYDLSLDRELGVGVDASHMGNEARFINDYRGISSGPNAEFRDILVDVGFGILEKRMGVYVLSAGKSGKKAKGISRGEEILLSYGKGFWAGRQAAAI